MGFAAYGGDSDMAADGQTGRRTIHWRACLRRKTDGKTEDGADGGAPKGSAGEHS